ncbi:hypothetical protein AWB82_04167 [Caballeronia glebae]|uniref:Uncharacterized protein n=1 Tax=Caballeronia glebae TaxID=1777143 RepID=A0A158BJ48_9BURK|nr:hypothetical protein [Caballeronia glebae]SAK70063.1 hypothetical protein AWB82_04167 [Caballeronia glebae]
MTMDFKFPFAMLGRTRASRTVLNDHSSFILVLQARRAKTARLYASICRAPSLNTACLSRSTLTTAHRGERPANRGELTEPAI